LVESFSGPPTDTQTYIITRTATFVAITIFQVIHAWFGLFHDNIYEIYANVVSQVVITVVVVFRCIFDMPWTIYLYALFSYAVLFLALYIIFLYLIHSEYSYTFYQKAGADPVFRSMYRKYLRFQAVLKIDFMLAVVSTMSFKTSDPNTSTSYLVTFNLIVAIIAAIYFNIGRFGVSNEVRPLVLVFWSLSPIQPVFYSYGVWEFINQRFWQLSGIEQEVAYLFLSSACAGVLVRIALVVLGSLAYVNFDKGLRDFEFLKQTREERVPFNYQNVQPREIDATMTVDEVIKNTQEAHKNEIYTESEDE